MSTQAEWNRTVNRQGLVQDVGIEAAVYLTTQQYRQDGLFCLDINPVALLRPNSKKLRNQASLHLDLARFWPLRGVGSFVQNVTLAGYFVIFAIGETNGTNCAICRILKWIASVRARTSIG